MTILNGLKILDFCSLLPGHFTTMMFADLGADVIHIESERRVDMMRIMPPYDGEHESYIHQHLNRSKKSVQINLKTAEGIDIVKKLIADYDILVEGFRPGVMKRLGIDYETLREINPRLIYCAITGYGQTGPYATRPGHDNNYLSIGGVLDHSRSKDKKPVAMGIQIADIAGGTMHAAVGILAAALHREKTGEGLRQIIGWLLGSVSMRGWSYVQMALPFMLIGSLLLWLNRRELNAMLFGEERAQHLGVDVKKRKMMILIGGSMLTGTAVAVSGTIGFVGLVVPHMTRLLFGSDNRHVLPLSFINGASLLIICDLISRTIISPTELPIGVITAFIGAPVFAFIFFKQRKKGGV